MRIDEILKEEKLPASASPRLDLELILAKVLRQPRDFLYKYNAYELNTEQKNVFRTMYKRALQGEPIAYILGTKEFWSLTLSVNKQVLIPRPETELLVEIILKLNLPHHANIADLGTGSGAIALALAREHSTWSIVATDVSRDALQVASFNARQLQIPNVEFRCGDWCHALPNKKFTIIVSNPPYIAKDDPHLTNKNIGFEPLTALAAGADGLTAFKKIIDQARHYLYPEGVLVLEHGYDQGDLVRQLLRDSNYRDIVPYQDLAGIYRAVTAKPEPK